MLWNLTASVEDPLEVLPNPSNSYPSKLAIGCFTLRPMPVSVCLSRPPCHSNNSVGESTVVKAYFGANVNRCSVDRPFRQVGSIEGDDATRMRMVRAELHSCRLPRRATTHGVSYRLFCHCGECKEFVIFVCDRCGLTADSNCSGAWAGFQVKVEVASDATGDGAQALNKQEASLQP